MSMRMPFVGNAVRIMRQMNFGYAVIFVSNGSMGNV